MERSLRKLLLKLLIVVGVVWLVFVAACRPGDALPLLMEQDSFMGLPSPTGMNAYTPTPTLKRTATLTPVLTATHARTGIPFPTETAARDLLRVTPVFAGSPIPSGEEKISARNISRLSNVARWGKGSILGLAFSPDGETFIVGSAFGFAIYSTRKPGNTPVWVAFEQPFYYENMFFNEDGDSILLEYVAGDTTTAQVRNFPGGELIRNDASGEQWLRTSRLNEGWGVATAISQDGLLEFRSHPIHDEEYWDVEYSVREIFDKSTDELLFELQDETIQVEFSDWHEPEGCDLSSFSYCGNVYSPSASHPYRVAFSPSGETLAVLYRPPNIWDSNRFSTLRIYDTDNGRVLARIGSFYRPVESFAYSPDGNTILIGYVDGLIQLWNIARGTDTFNARHFNTLIIDVDYSYDGKYVIIQNSEAVEIRLARNGALRGRYDATTFSTSPVSNKIALGTKDGKLRVFDIDTGDTSFNVQAHDSEIYALAFSPDGQRITSSGKDCDVRNWDAATGESIHYFEENKTDAYMESNTESRIFTYYMQYVPGTNRLLGFGSWGRVVSWDTISGATQYLIEPEPLEYYNGMITLNPHFPEFFRVDLEHSEFYVDVTRYSIETGEKMGEFVLPENLPEGCAPFGPVLDDGRILISKGYDDRSGQLCVLDAETYELLHSIDVVSNASSSRYLDIDWVYLSPNQKQLIANVHGGVLYVYQIVP